MASRNKNFKINKEPIKIRKSWGVINPVTKVIPNKKSGKYNRAKEKRIHYDK